MVYDGVHYEIRKGFPMPDREMTRGDSNGRYHFGDMEVGDCFLFPERDRNRISAASSKYGQRHGVTFAIRDLGHALGIWRTS